MTTRIAITSSLFLAAMLLIPSAQAMSPAPLHPSDGMITQARRIAARGCAGMKHSVVARLHPPVAMSAEEWLHPTDNQEARPCISTAGLQRHQALGRGSLGKPTFPAER